MTILSFDYMSVYNNCGHGVSEWTRFALLQVMPISCRSSKNVVCHVFYDQPLVRLVPSS